MSRSKQNASLWHPAEESDLNCFSWEELGFLENEANGIGMKGIRKGLIQA